MIERPLGVVVRALACGAEGPRIEITFNQVSGKLSLFTQQQMGTRPTSELGRFRWLRERRWASPFTCHTHWQMWNPNISAPTANRMWDLPLPFITFKFVAATSECEYLFHVQNTSLHCIMWNSLASWINFPCITNRYKNHSCVYVSFSFSLSCFPL